MKAPKLMATVLLAVTLALAAPASAVFYYFDNITNNIAGDAAIGEAQLSMDVTALGMNQVLFTFFNSGPAASSITDIYFEDGALLGIASILDTPPDVAFSQIDVAPPDLPGGGAVGFNTTSGFSADSDAPVAI